MIDKIRALVRPISVIGLIGAFIIAALSPLLGAGIEDAKFACTALGPFAGLILQQWFNSRKNG